MTKNHSSSVFLNISEVSVFCVFTCYMYICVFQSFEQMQSYDTAQHNGCSVIKMLQALCQALLDSKRENKERVAAENAAIKEQAAEITALAAKNAALKKLAAEKQAAMKEQAAKITALKKQAAQNSALAAENAALQKLAAEKQAGMKEQAAELTALRKEAAQNTALVAENAALQKLSAEKLAAMKEQAAELCQVKDDFANMMEELEKEVKDFQLQHVEKQKVESQWKVKFQALQKNCEERLRCRVLEQEASFQEKDKKQLKKIQKKKAKEEREGTERRNMFSFLFPFWHSS
ncbi:histone H1-like protein HC2 isoform X2 [Paralichthys olivaceus]|uniref:histone H1-like protein HC2 isoform X2 n=1 Tax=Paralichthys olivaceus TaxID=8255 RepID=UPI003751AF83